MAETAQRSPVPEQTPPAQACLEPLLNALGWTGGPRRLCEALPEEQPVSDIPALFGVLENLQFRAVPYQSIRTEPGDEALPALLDKADGDVWVLIEVEKPGHYKVFKGRQGRLATIQADELNGQIHLVCPAEKKAGESTQRRLGLLGSMLENQPGFVQTLFGISLLINCLALALPAYVMTVFDLAADAGSMLTLMAVAGGTIVVVSTEIILREARARSIARFAVRSHKKVMEAAFERITSLPVQVSERASAEGLINRLKSFEAMRDIFGSPLSAGLLDLPFVVLFIAAAFIIGGWLGWLVAGMVAALAVLSAVFVTRIRLKFLKASISRSQTQRFREDMIANLPIIQCGNAEEIWERRYSRLVSRELAADAEMQRMAVSEAATAQALAMLTGALIISFGANAVIGGELSAGALVALLVIVWRVLAPLQSVLLNINGLFQAIDAASQFRKLMRLPQEKSRPSTLPYEQISGRIDLQDVCYRKRNAGLPVLQKITVTADPGELVAVTGDSGAGKGALLRLIANLERPNSGCVRIDGFDARQFDIRHLRQRIAFVSEDQRLFPGSLAYNFRLVNPFADEELIRAAITDAELDAFIGELDEGLETDLTDQLYAGLATNVYSKLRLARAYVQDPAIYLFDEPLKDLDAAGRRAFINKLAELKGKKTIIAGTSDDETLSLADKVVHLQAGEIAELTVRPPDLDESATRSLRSLLEKHRTEATKRSASA